MKLSKKQENLIANYFHDKPVLKAYVFGSYSRDEADENSDIDLMIELDRTNPIGLKFFGYQSELEGILGKEIDLATDNALSKYIRENVMADRKLIYEMSTSETESSKS